MYGTRWWILGNLCYNSPCLSMLVNCSSPLLLDRLGTCLKLFVSSESTSCYEFASQFGLAIVLYAKNTQNIGETGSTARVLIWMKQRPAIDSQRNRRKRSLTPSRSGATDPSNSDNMNGDGGVCLCVCARACARVFACVYDLLAIYDNTIWPRLILIIINIISYKSHILMTSPQRVSG